MKLHHPNCTDPKCDICLEDHEELGRLLDKLCETGNKKDHLAGIYLWLSRNGKEPETEWGWFKPEVFQDENIRQYVKRYKAENIK